MKYDTIIDVYLDEENKFKYAVVDAEIGQIRINDETKFNKFLDDIKKSGENVVINEIKDKKETEDTPTSEIDEIFYEIEEEYSKKGKMRKSKKFITKLVAWSSAIVILAVGGIHLKKYTNIFDGKKIIFGNSNTNIETKDPDKIVVKDNTNGKTTEFDKVMSGVVSNQTTTSKVTNQLAEGDYGNLSSSEIMSALDNNWRLANSSIIEISNYLNGYDLNGNAYYGNFSKSFSDKEDKAVVEYFSVLRNKIVSAAYEDKSASSVKTNAKALYSDFAKFVIGGNKLNVTINGKTKGVAYSELSDMAKGIVLQIGMAALMMPVDYTYYNQSQDWTYKKMDIIENASTMYYEDLMPAINKGSSK